MNKNAELRRVKKQLKLVTGLYQTLAIVMIHWEQSILFRLWKMIHHKELATARQRVKELKNK
jgi:hypothetical protein